MSLRGGIHRTVKWEARDREGIREALGLPRSEAVSLVNNLHHVGRKGLLSRDEDGRYRIACKPEL